MIFKYIKQFIDFSQEQRKNMIAALSLGFFQSLFNAFSLMAASYVLGTILDGTVQKSTAWISMGIVLAGMVGAYFCNYFSMQKQTEAGYTTGANARIRIAERLRYAPMGYFSQRNLGQITNTATNTADSLQETLTRCMVLSVQGLLNTAAITIAMFIFDWRIGLVTLGGFGVFLLANNKLHKVGEKISERKVKSVDIDVEAILEYVQGAAVIKSYNLTGKANKKVSDSEDMLTAAKERIAKHSLSHVSAIQGDVGDLPFEDSAFDIVLSMNGFHAFPDKERAFSETARVLKPGGMFLGCFYIKGETKRSDFVVNVVLARKGWFTPPFQTKNDVLAALKKRYTKVELFSEKAMVWFRCIK